jgi:hypothetical protein
MPPFLHQRLHRLEELLQSADSALRASSSHDPDLLDLAAAHLGDAGAVYAQLGISDAENQMVALAAQVAGASDGVNPLTLERVSSRRREMQRIVVLHVLQVSSERLRGDYADVRRSLELLRDRLTPLALYALQRGLVLPAPGSEPTQADLETLWQALTDDPESRQATQQIAISATSADVLLMLGELLLSVR